MPFFLSDCKLGIFSHRKRMKRYEIVLMQDEIHKRTSSLVLIRFFCKSVILVIHETEKPVYGRTSGG